MLSSWPLKVIARVHSVHLMNAAQRTSGRRPSDQATWYSFTIGHFNWGSWFTSPRIVVTPLRLRVVFVGIWLITGQTFELTTSSPPSNSLGNVKAEGSQVDVVNVARQRASKPQTPTQTERFTILPTGRHREPVLGTAVSRLARCCCCCCSWWCRELLMTVA